MPSDALMATLIATFTLIGVAQHRVTGAPLCVEDLGAPSLQPSCFPYSPP